MPLDRGRITTQHTVWCQCQCWVQVDEDSRREVAAQVKRMGWVYSKDKGWTCRGCVKGPNEHGRCDHSRCN